MHLAFVSLKWRMQSGRLDRVIDWEMNPDLILPTALPNLKTDRSGRYEHL